MGREQVRKEHGTFHELHSRTGVSPACLGEVGAMLALVRSLSRRDARPTFSGRARFDARPKLGGRSSGAAPMPVLLPLENRRPPGNSVPAAAQEKSQHTDDQQRPCRWLRDGGSGGEADIVDGEAVIVPGVLNVVPAQP